MQVHSQQQDMKVPVAPHPSQYMVSSVFSNSDILIVCSGNCGFNLHFPMFSFIYHPNIFFGEMSIKIFCSFCFWLFIFLLLSLETSLYILNTILPVNGCLFILLKGLLKSRVLKLMKSNLSNFFLLGIVLLMLCVRNLCLTKNHRSSPIMTEVSFYRFYNSMFYIYDCDLFGINFCIWCKV